MRRFIPLLNTVQFWLALPLLVTLVGFLPGGYISNSTLLMLYLIGVLYCSVRTEVAGLTACSVLSFLLFNFFFTEPRYSLLMNDLNELVSALLFVAFAILTGNVSYQLKAQLRSLEAQGRFLQAQVDLGEKMQRIEREEDLLPLLHNLSRDIFDGEVGFRLLPARSAQNPDDTWHMTWTLPGAGKLDEERQAMLLSVREEVQPVLERLAVSRALKQAERKSDEDRLRSALLSSVSQDLKTPLVTMRDLATALREQAGDESAQRLDSIISESRRLERYIENLIDMTRLGQGELTLSRQWITVEKIYRVVMRRIDRQWPDNRVTLKAEPELPSLQVHAALVEQALFNAIDNALKAGGKDAEVVVDVRKTGPQISIRVCDHGPGLPESEWEAVFDQFYTCGQYDQHYETGIGLGLSICRSIFRIHGGDAVIVPAPREFGHCLLMTLPFDAAA